jgi:hypothetical protein
MACIDTDHRYTHPLELGPQPCGCRPAFKPDPNSMRRSPQDQNQLRPLAQLIPSRLPHKSMSASTTRPARHSAPWSLSNVARPHEVGLIILSWRADSLAFVWLDPGITPCCKSRFASLITNFLSHRRVFHVRMWGSHDLALNSPVTSVIGLESPLLAVLACLGFSREN